MAETVDCPDCGHPTDVRLQSNGWYCANPKCRTGSFFLPPAQPAQRQFVTGSVRDHAAGKGRYDLLPWWVIHRDAVHYEMGAAKYGERNWEKGIPLSSFVDSAFRHLQQLATGATDEDHGAAVRFNVAGFVWTLNAIQAGRLPRELADLPGVTVSENPR